MEGSAEATLTMDHEVVADNVRRYRAIASLCRQAAAFRPAREASLLVQANDWDLRAVCELEAYLELAHGRDRRRAAEALGEICIRDRWF